MKILNLRTLSSLLLLIILISACTPGRSTGNAPTATAPVAAAPEVTFTPAPSSTPEASDTPLASATPADTATPSPTATPVVPMVEAKDAAAYCRFGPSLDYLSIGFLEPGIKVPVEATVLDNSWWEISNPSNPSTYCWVANTVTVFTGDLASLPIVGAPNGNAIRANVSLTASISGSCSGSNTNTFEGTITANGPSVIGYHWEVDNAAGDVLSVSASMSLTFHTAGTQPVTPGSFTGGCGNYVVRLIVTYPNNLQGQATYTVGS